MKALIIYDSFYGNTEQIARAMCSAIDSQGTVSAIQVGEARLELLTSLDLLIVGSPTRQFRPSPSIQNFLKGIPLNYLEGVKVAAFDTRIAFEDVKVPILRLFIKVFGYAAQPIAKQLKAKGGVLAQDPEGFVVQDTEGPLKEGELERAARWAENLNSTD